MARRWIGRVLASGDGLMDAGAIVIGTGAAVVIVLVVLIVVLLLR